MSLAYLADLRQQYHSPLAYVFLSIILPARPHTNIYITYRLSR